MSNAPLMLGLKASFVREAPFAGSGGYLSSSYVSDAYTPENVAFYAERDHTVSEVWAIYVSPDRRSILTVNMDGTLRALNTRIDPAAEPQPHPYWA